MNPLRQLPSVSQVLECQAVRSAESELPRPILVDAIRQELAQLRKRISADGSEGTDPIPSVEQVAASAVVRARRELQPKLRAVINATGIVLHTNLGRSPMADSAARAAYEAARGYLNLELDLESGKRSSRQIPIREWICRLTGAESATVVNNNAAATVIVLRALCRGREVIISRGQLIEIGGSFRIPEIMAVSGATLREVGTTNITRISDYEKAINENTGALMQVHTSNYRVCGFTKSATLEEIVALGRSRGLPVIDDIGSGAMVDYSRFGFSDEPVVGGSIATGVDLVLFSGDKLLGGPQAGIIAGKRQWIERIEKDPLMRAFRLDKMTLAALEATLRLYLDEEQALREIPVLRMAGTRPEELKARARRLASKLRRIDGIAEAQVREDQAYIGGGSLPAQPLPTVVVEVRPAEMSETELAYRLRTGDPAVVARLADGRLLFDPRTVFPEQEAALVSAVASAVSASDSA